MLAHVKRIIYVSSNNNKHDLKKGASISKKSQIRPKGLMSVLQLKSTKGLAHTNSV